MDWAVYYRDYFSASSSPRCCIYLCWSGDWPDPADDEAVIE